MINPIYCEDKKKFCDYAGYDCKCSLGACIKENKNENMRKQYRYCNTATWKYEIDIYHDGKLVENRSVWIDELDDEVDKLEEQGYTYGYTKKEVEEAKQKYESILENLIF